MVSFYNILSCLYGNEFVIKRNLLDILFLQGWNAFPTSCCCYLFFYLSHYSLQVAKILPMFQYHNLASSRLQWGGRSGYKGSFGVALPSNLLFRAVVDHPGPMWYARCTLDLPPAIASVHHGHRCSAPLIYLPFFMEKDPLC